MTLTATAMTAQLGPSMSREEQWLAPYAQFTARSAGRRFVEPPHPYRSAYERDRDRIMHSAAWRRLADKTQVFTGEPGEYHRTRLTHSLEVMTVARSLARSLRLNEDLVDALALLHDLGHPPFGHSGEETLDRLLQSEGGFCHNRQALRIVEEFEHRTHLYPGLNLTREVLDGQAARVDKSRQADRPLLEVQSVDAADSVVYDSHDPDDAVEVGLLRIEELLEVGLWREAAARVAARYAALEPRELRRAVAHELIDWQVGDLIAGTAARILEQGVDSVGSVRRAGWLMAPGPEIAEPKQELETFLLQRVYRHPDLLARRARLQELLAERFEHLSRDPKRLPAPWQSRIAMSGLRRTLCDYLASLTDRGALTCDLQA